MDLLGVYSQANRRRLLLVATLVTLGIAFVDRATTPYVALGFLYLFPIMLVGGFLSRWQVVAFGAFCALLQDLYGYLPGSLLPSLPSTDELHIAISRLMFTAMGFVGTGLFVSELVRNRRMVLKNLEEVSDQVRLRRDAEHQLRALIESSPAAIVTVDSLGKVLVANEAAKRLLAPGDRPLIGESIESFLPALQTAVQMNPARVFKTTLQCKGQRSTGEVFLAGVWFSRYETVGGPQLAAIVVDLSEDVRNREDLNFEHLLKSTSLLMSAVSHEIRNLCGAALVVHKNLSRVKALNGNEDFSALGTVIQGLEKISELELRPAAQHTYEAVELKSVLDELRVLIETAYRESEVEVRWHANGDLPQVWADHYGLVQVFLNLSRNSLRAMRNTECKTLDVSASVQEDSVVVRFEDSGIGIQHAEDLFHPFQRGAEATGLGLYVSRAILKSFGAEIRHEPRSQGCCFAVVLQCVSEATQHA